MDSDEARTLRAKLWHPDLGDIGEGSITYGYDSIARFVMDGFGRDLDLSEDQLAGGVQAIAEDGRRLSLFNCECRGRTLFPAFVIGGDVKSTHFQSFEVRYSDVSEWFFQQMTVHSEPGTRIEWQTLPPPLVADISLPGHNFKSESFYVGSLDHQGEDRNLHQHFEFRFTATQGRFSLDDIKHYVLRFSNLLSVLLAHPCSIASIDVSVDGKHGARLYYGIFNSTQNQKPDNDAERITRRTFLTQKDDVDGCWESVVNKFFSSNYREVIWSRVAGMQNYEGFWEYRVLGYVTLLDSYVTQTFNKRVATKPTKKLQLLELALTRVQPPLDQKQQSDVIAAAAQIFTSDTSSFQSKFHELLNVMDADVKKIVNLSPTDFKTIKELRDEIAHGQQPSFTGPDFTPIMVIMNRIVLLLTYLFFYDVGLGPNIFLQGLAKPFSKLRRESNIDEVHLARVLRPSSFFSVSEQDMVVIRNRPRRLHCSCFTRDRNGLISYSEGYSEAIQNNLHTRRTGRQHELLDLPEEAVRYVGDAYFEHGTHTESVHSTILINLTHLPV